MYSLYCRIIVNRILSFTLVSLKGLQILELSCELDLYLVLLNFILYFTLMVLRLFLRLSMNYLLQWLLLTGSKATAKPIVVV